MSLFLCLSSISLEFYFQKNCQKWGVRKKKKKCKGGMVPKEGGYLLHTVVGKNDNKVELK